MNADLGIIGLGSMAENLIIQLSNKGFRVSLYNRTAEKLKDFVSRNAGLNIIANYDLKSFVNSIERPRKIFLLIKAGEAVDNMLISLSPFLEKGDIIVDCGNSHFKDTERRFSEFDKKGIKYLGAGISGGVEGARKGLSIMVGGDRLAYETLAPIFDSISSRYNSRPAHGYFGKGGAGHFVKIIHNGIEYALIENIAETYFLLKSIGKGNEEISGIFDDWSKRELKSYLLSAASEVLKLREDGNFLVDLILDKAEQKGTGRWASEISLELGIPAPSICSAVISRTISSFKERRLLLSKTLEIRKKKPNVEEHEIYNALLLSNIAAYVQGFDIMRNANEYSFNLKDIMHVWQGGSIIRSLLIERFMLEKSDDPLSWGYVLNTLQTHYSDFLKVVSEMNACALPALVFSSSLNYFIYFFSPILPANITQALRDHFGDHGFQRIDKTGEFHLNIR
ncbi:MAG TPA: NADP-dependent phosphogluconate dehydrogenase [Geobacterales bacterium]|nr:NADP-dependent phosphogluconate dehydrogenase [Geobacterales bacterium]